MFLHQISDSSNMDKEAKNTDEICGSPAFSNSVTSEIPNIQTAEGLDELMHCDDVLDNEEDTWPHTEETTLTCSSLCRSMSADSLMTYSSSRCSSPDSDISEMITSFDQNVDEVITQVCHNFLYPADLETEEGGFGEKGEDWTTETESTSRLAIRSEERGRPASCASSSSRSTAITKAAKMLVSQVIDEAIKMLQSTEPVKTIKDSDAPPQSDLSSNLLELVTPEETRNAVPSPLSTSLFSPAHQVDKIPWPQSQLLVKTATEIQEEVRCSPSRQSRDSHDGVLKPFPPGPSEEDGHRAFSQENKGAAADRLLILKSCTITAFMRRFLQSLSEK